MSFCEGNLVWAKMKGYPYWPGRICRPPKSPRSGHSFVHFFGTENNAFIQNSLIQHHSQAMVDTLQQKKVIPSDLRKATDEIIEEAAKGPQELAMEEEATEEEAVSVPQEAAEDSSQEAAEILEEVMHVTRGEEEEPVDVGTDAVSALKALPSTKSPSLKVKRISKGKAHRTVLMQMPQRPLMRSVVLPFIGLLGASSPLVNRLATRLMEAGFPLTVWDSKPECADGLVRAGAQRGETAAVVVLKSNLTFGCAFDTAEAKNWMFEPAGVLAGLEEAKENAIRGRGYVELSRLDNRSSMDICQAVKLAGGQYLEAPLCYASHPSNTNNPLLVSGSCNLFMKNKKCFRHLADRVYYTSYSAGRAASLAHLTSSLVGTHWALAGEALALVDRFGISRKDLIKVAELVGYDCDMLRGKCPFGPTIAQQRADQRCALQVTNEHGRPASMLASANEMYKKASRLGYANKDTSAMHQASKF